MSRRKFKAVRFVSFLELSDDTDELLELLSQAESLNIQAETELKLRRNETALIKNKLKKVRGELKELRISDHAIVRYLERVTKLDIAACKEEILKKLPDGLTTTLEPVFVTLSDDKSLQYVIRDNLIISVTPVRADDPVSDLVAEGVADSTDVSNPPSDPKRKANT